MLNVFADSNLFLQCRPLRELPWNEISSTEIKILIPRAVAREMDRLKSAGNHRRAQKARNAINIFQALIQDGAIEVECKTQKVSICSHERLNLSSPLDLTLDLSEPDDSIVNEVLAWKEKHQDKDVMVLTGDTNLCNTCQYFNVAYFYIPDIWRLPPEPDPLEKENRKLKTLLQQYEESNPKINVSFASSLELKGRFLSLIVTEYEPLSEQEVEDAVSKILALYPLQTDFTKPPNFPSAPIVGLDMFLTKWQPPSQVDVTKYQFAYETWKEALYEYLRNLHVSERYENYQDVGPHLTVYIENNGGVPAEGLMVEFSIEGTDEVVFTKSLGQMSKESVPFPKPPTPPSGNAFKKLMVLAEEFSNINIDRRPPLINFAESYRRDPYAFYKRKSEEQFSSYECAQFHRMKERSFNFHFQFALEETGKSGGQFSCRVFGKNLRSPLDETLNLLVVRDIQSLDERLAIIIQGRG